MRKTVWCWGGREGRDGEGRGKGTVFQLRDLGELEVGSGEVAAEVHPQPALQLSIPPQLRPHGQRHPCPGSADHHFHPLTLTSATDWTPANAPTVTL